MEVCPDGALICFISIDVACQPNVFCISSDIINYVTDSSILEKTAVVGVATIHHYDTANKVNIQVNIDNCTHMICLNSLLETIKESHNYQEGTSIGDQKGLVFMS